MIDTYRSVYTVQAIVTAGHVYNFFFPATYDLIWFDVVNFFDEIV